MEEHYKIKINDKTVGKIVTNDGNKPSGMTIFETVKISKDDKITISKSENKIGFISEDKI